MLRLCVLRCTSKPVKKRYIFWLRAAKTLTREQLGNLWKPDHMRFCACLLLTLVMQEN